MPFNPLKLALHRAPPGKAKQPMSADRHLGPIFDSGNISFAGPTWRRRAF